MLREDGSDDAYSYVISAEDGRLLMRPDLTSHAGYRVWADAFWATIRATELTTHLARGPDSSDQGLATLARPVTRS